MKTRFPSAPGNRSAAFPLFSHPTFLLPFSLSLSPRQPIVLFLRRECAPNAANNDFLPLLTRQGSNGDRWYAFGRGKRKRGKNSGGEGSRRTAGNSSTVSSFSSDYHADAYFIRRVIKFVALRVWPSLNEWRINDDVKLYVAFVVDACIV